MLANKLLEKMKQHPELARMGMIASHLGLVRGTSLDGTRVDEMEVQFDLEAVERIRDETKRFPGIVEVLVACNPGKLKVGDEVMAVAVGGDTREHVFPALVKAVDRIKVEATKKREIRLEDS